MTHPILARLRRTWPLGLAIPFLLVAGGCRSERKLPAQQEQIDLESLRELIAKNTLEPVVALEGEDPFADAESEFRPAFEGIEPNMTIGSLPEVGDAEPGAAQEGSESKPDPLSVDPFVVDPLEDEQYPENPFIEFGSRIVSYEDGRIMKPYPLPVGRGKAIDAFVRAYAPFKLYEEGEAVHALDTVRVDLMENFDSELVWSLRDPVMKQGESIILADWLLVTASAELLREFEFFLNTFARPPQIEIEAKIVEVVVNDELDLGVRQINDTTPIVDWLDNDTLIDDIGFNFPNMVDGTETLLTLSAVQNGVAYNAIFEALATYENVSISSHPKVAVREGVLAKIENATEIPYFNISGISNEGNFNAQLTFKSVGIKLYVIPRIVGTSTVALNVDVEASQQSGEAVAFTDNSGNVLSNPVISVRAAQTVVHLEPGQAVIIGGLVSDRTVEMEKKFPILGDIPILGFFFRSTLRRKESTNVLFFIRPRILQGSELNREF